MPCEEKPVSAGRGGGGGGVVNDLSSSFSSSTSFPTSAGGRPCCGPVPAAAACLLAPLLLAGIGVSVFIFVVVRNAALLVALLAFSLLLLAFFLWNASAARSRRGLLLFLHRFRGSDLRTAADGQLVKITGFASCGDVSLFSSYEKVGRCVYTSTLLYTFNGFMSKLANLKIRCFRSNLSFLERLAADFYITDSKSGISALVKAGHNSRVIPLLNENVLVKTTNTNGELSSTLRKWLEERNLSSESSLLRLEEGYISEGMSLTVMGILSRKNGMLMIVPPPEPISTGCLLQNLLLPIDFDGLLLKISDKN